MKDTHREGMDEYFPQFIRLFLYRLRLWDGHESCEETYREKVERENFLIRKESKAREEMIEIAKRLRGVFQGVGLEVPWNAERYSLLQCILEFYRQDIELVKAVGFPLPDPHPKGGYYIPPPVKAALYKQLAAQLATFQDSTALAWGIEFLFKLADAKTDERLLEQPQLALAEMAAKAGDTQKAIDLFHDAFNRQLRGEPSWKAFGHGVRHFLFEDSSFARDLLAKIEKLTKHYHSPRVILLTEYSHLKALYQEAPFAFFAPWEDKDKIQLMLDVITWISTPFDAHDHALFQQFRQLIKPVREACLLLEEFDKYFDLAEIFARHGNEPVSFKLYGLICQALKEEVLRWPILPYPGSRHPEYPDWDTPFFHHARVDGRYPRPRIHQGKTLFQFLEKVPVDPESGLFAEILAMFLGRPSWFDRNFLKGHVSLFKALVLNRPEKVRAFCSRLRGWNDLTIELVLTILPELRDEEINSLLQKVKAVDGWTSADLHFWDEHSFFISLIFGNLPPKSSELKPIFGKLVKVERVLQQLRTERQATAEFNHSLAELQRLLDQIDAFRGTALFASVIPTLQRWREVKGRNLGIFLDEITEIFYEECLPEF